MNMTNITKRLHARWLPPYISHVFVEEYFSQFVDVQSVDYTHDSANFINHATRVVRILMDDYQRADLPQIANFNNGRFRMVTCPGRVPMCTRCYDVGHVRRECQQNTNSCPRAHPTNEEPPVVDVATEDEKETSTAPFTPNECPHTMYDSIVIAEEGHINVSIVGKDTNVDSKISLDISPQKPGKKPQKVHGRERAIPIPKRLPPLS